MQYQGKILLILLGSIVSSCANLGDRSTDLGDGYSYDIDGSRRWISADNVMKDGIYPNVVKYGFNDGYIILVQEPSKDLFKRALTNELQNKYEFVFDTSDTSTNDYFIKRFKNSHLWLDRKIHLAVIKQIRPNHESNNYKIELVADSLINNDPYYKRNTFKETELLDNRKKEQQHFRAIYRGTVYPTKKAPKFTQNVQIFNSIMVDNNKTALVKVRLQFFARAGAHIPRVP